MDFVAHLLWSAIIFSGPQLILGILCGVLPDLIPFGLETIIGPYRNKNLPKRKWPDKQGMLEYFKRPQNQWIYKLYNWTHSLFIWSIILIVFWLLIPITQFTPWFVFAAFFHIVIDIPTHTKAFFAPQFLTPVSKFCVDGIPWSNPKIMIINYSLILIFGILRLLGVLWVIQ